MNPILDLDWCFDHDFSELPVHVVAWLYALVERGPALWVQA